ncbi:UDP-glucose 4-epimerase [Cupriavidus sp. H18C2]
MAQTLLLTGATGYIASHTWLALHAAGYQVIGLDNLCNSNREVVNRLARITGTTPQFVEGDVRDRALLDRLFAEHDITGAIHFAALKAVGESVSQPLAYYGNNLEGMITLCSAMQAAGVKQLVFSSSATVYGNPHTVPILEDFPLSATNPYGQTKLMGEQILRDLEKSDPE